MNLLVCFADESKFAKFESSFRNAIVEKNKNKLKSLYFQPDAELELLEKAISYIMAFGDIQKIELIDLPKDFESVNVANGFEYQFNLKPIGQINLVGKSGTMQINYGKINSEIWLVGTKKVPLSTAAPPENIYNITVDTILGGKFSGYCFYTS